MAATIDPVFDSALKDVMSAALESSTALRDGTPRPWALLSVPALDSTSIHNRFDRTGLEKMYVGLWNDRKSMVKECISVKQQSDLLSRMERDFRMRHVSRVRTVVFEVSRRYGQQHEKGVVQVGLLDPPRVILTAEATSLHKYASGGPDETKVSQAAAADAPSPKADPATTAALASPTAQATAAALKDCKGSNNVATPSLGTEAMSAGASPDEASAAEQTPTDQWAGFPDPTGDA